MAGGSRCATQRQAGDRWAIARLDAVYERDTLNPANPSGRVRGRPTSMPPDRDVLTRDRCCPRASTPCLTSTEGTMTTNHQIRVAGHPVVTTRAVRLRRPWYLRCHSPCSRW